MFLITGACPELDLTTLLFVFCVSQIYLKNNSDNYVEKKIHIQTTFTQQTIKVNLNYCY